MSSCWSIAILLIALRAAVIVLRLGLEVRTPLVGLVRAERSKSPTLFSTR